MWSDSSSVRLTRPSVIESEDVTRRLIEEQQTGKQWSFTIFSSSPESTAVTTILISVQGGHLMHRTLNCQRYSKTIKMPELLSPLFTGGTKQPSDVLCSNATLEEFVFYDVTGITVEYMPH